MQTMATLAQRVPQKIKPSPKSQSSAASIEPLPIGYTAKTLGSFQYDHLSPNLTVGEDAYSERDLLRSVISGVGEWMLKHQTRPGLSFIVVSGGLPETAVIKDHNGRSLPASLFDGFGCGKTTMAEIMYSSCCEMVAPYQGDDSLGRKIDELRAAPDDDPGLVYVARATDATIEQARNSLIASYMARAGEYEPPKPQVNYKGRFFTAADLMAALAGGKDDQGNQFTERAGAIIGLRSEIVVIDDVGREGNLPFIAKEVQTAEMQNRYYRVVDYCYRRFKNGDRCPSLVITSNLRVEQLKAHLGGAVWTRLEEMCPPGFIHDMTGVRNWRKLARTLV